MSSFVWQQTGENCFEGNIGRLQIACQPPRGLQLKQGRLQLPAALGIEIVYVEELGAQPLISIESAPEVIIRQDTLLVRYAPSKERAVECDIRWQVSPEGFCNLEVSALTPGKWKGLAVQTCTRLPDGEVMFLDEVTPPILIYRPSPSPSPQPSSSRGEGEEMSYIEFCHPQDGIGYEQKTSPDGDRVVRFRLFGHDLEKGVILRGRLRGQLVPRAEDLAAARAAYQRFLMEPPNLSL